MKALLLIILMVLVGCKSASEKRREDMNRRTTSLLSMLSAQGTNLKVVRGSPDHQDYMVFENTETGELVAYDVMQWDPHTMTSLDQYTGNVVRNLDAKSEWVVSGYYETVYSQELQSQTYWDEDCRCFENEWVWVTVSSDGPWVDTSHFETFYYGGGFRFENTNSAGKDLETIAAMKEGEAKKAISTNLKSAYALSGNRAEELAALTYKYARMENARELTASEKDQFAKKALGVSLTDIESALMKKALGSDDAYNDLLKQAAQTNRTSPEMIGKFFDEMIEL